MSPDTRNTLIGVGLVLGLIAGVVVYILYQNGAFGPKA